MKRKKVKKTSRKKASVKKKARPAKKKPRPVKAKARPPAPSAPAAPKPRPRKVKPIEKSQWEPIRKMLMAKRQEVVEAMNRIRTLAESSPDVGDEADQAGQSIEKELQFELSDNERTQLDQIEGALRKMEKGTYGICEQCQKPIQKLRIKALPFARYCIACQSTAERASFL